MSSPESQNPNSPGPENTSGDDSGQRVRGQPLSAPKQRRWFRSLLLLLMALLILFGAGAWWGYLQMRSASDQRFAQRLQQHAEEGGVVDVQQVRDIFALPRATLDTTDAWEEAINTFAQEEYEQLANDVREVFSSAYPTWGPKRWDDFDRAEELIENHEDELANVQLAATGVMLHKIGWKEDRGLSEESLNGLLRAYELLELSCYIRAGQEDYGGLVRSLSACLTFSNCLVMHPDHVGEYFAIEHRALETLLSALETVHFKEEQLVHFRDLIQGRDPWQPIRKYWAYQTSIRLLMYTDVQRFLDSALGQSMAADPTWATFLDNLHYNVDYSPFAGDDAIAFMDFMESIPEYFSGNPLVASEKVQKREEEIWQTTPERTVIIRQPTARHMVPPVSHLIDASVDFAVLREIALAALALDYDRVRSESLTPDLHVAADGFLDRVPLDLYTGDPVHTKTRRLDLLIYSYGPDQVDDELGEDDIGIALPRKKWGMHANPLQPVD